MRILINHCSYPSQFRRLAPALVAAGHELVFLHRHREWHAPEPNGFRLCRYPVARAGEEPAGHPYLRRFEDAVAEGQGAFRAACQLREKSFYPDLIISHAGFGGGLYLGDVFPKAKRIGLFEWYYNAFGSDVDFLQQGQIEPDRQLRLRTWNSHLLLELADCDAAVVPTDWQRQQFPSQWRQQLHLIHEGVDVPSLSKLRLEPPPAPAWMPRGQGVELVSYVSRGFEAYRGFPQAMQALAVLQQQRPGVQVLIAGSDAVCYGACRSDGRSWAEWARQEAGLDPTRTHWLGALQTADYHALLAHTQVHLYLTVPFVLSWSLLEAMAAGCPVVASATAPVEEVLQHGHQGLLAPFWQPTTIANQLASLLEDPQKAAALGAAALSRAEAYSAEKGLSDWLLLIERLREGPHPAMANSQT
jgi:glycosyltransferase involved in cell wall biosynthesis